MEGAGRRREHGDLSVIIRPLWVFFDLVNTSISVVTVLWQAVSQSGAVGGGSTRRVGGVCAVHYARCRFTRPAGPKRDRTERRA